MQSLASNFQSTVLRNNVKSASGRSTRQVVSCSKGPVDVQKVAAQVAGVFAAGAVLAQGAGAFTKDEIKNLTYLQVKGTGLANQCPVVLSDTSDIDLGAGKYRLDHLCLEPTKFTVKEENKKGESDFVDTKLMTRLTYSLDEISGEFEIKSDGSVAFKEEDGIDYAAVTVQLPGGERVPFLFTVKELTASGTKNQFGGDFSVPSYRGSSFLDPKGRGASTGYENAVALPAAGNQDELDGENVKNAASLKGSIVFNVAKVDKATGEIAGVFESIQPSDTDLGSKAPKDIKIIGIWYAQLS